MRKRLSYLAGLLSDGKQYEEKDDIYRKKLTEMYKPLEVVGGNSFEIAYDKQYERMKLIIAQRTNLDIQSLTVFQYYAYLEAVKEQADEEQKATKRIKKN